MNFLQETKKAIKNSGHTPTDIVFIGSTTSGHSCTWDEFTTLADFRYDDGYGAQEIATDVKVVFSDGASMWRYEYDGSEKWEYGEPFVPPLTTYPITTFRSGDVWATLQEMNQLGGRYGTSEE